MKGLQGTIGRYQILGHWASGRSSEIYAIRGEVPGGRLGTYALKLMSVGDVAPAFRDQLLLRATALARFQRPQVACIRDAFVHEGMLCVVEDFIAGETLEHVLRSEGAPLSPSLAMGIAMEIATALQECHEARDHTGAPVWHGDICPAHIMLTYEGDVILLDVGLSLVESRVRRDGRVRGHFGYFSPERATRALESDPRSDVYSVGLILWEMLTGLPALGGTNEAELLQYARRGHVPPPSSRIRIGASLDGVVEQALAHAPSDRFRSARDLAGALSEILFNRRPSWSTRVEVERIMQRRFAHRARATRTLLNRWGGSEAAGASIRVETGPTAVLARPERPVREVAMPARPRTRELVAPPRPSGPRPAEPRLLADPALDAVAYAQTDDIPGRATGDLRAPESSHMTLLWGFLIILAGALSAIVVTMLLPEEWRSSADGSGGTIGGSMVALFGSIVRWIMDRAP